MDHLTVSTSLEADQTAVLRLRGDLDYATSDKLQAAIDALPDSLTWIVVDLGEVDFVDSTGIMVLIRLRRSREGTRVSLRYAREGALLALRTTQVLGLFDVEAPAAEVEALPSGEDEPPLVTTTRSLASGVVVSLSGDLDAVSAPILLAAVHEATGDLPPGPLALDLEGLNFVDTGGLAALVTCSEQARGKVRLENVTGATRRTLIMGGLDEVFDLDELRSAR